MKLTGKIARDGLQSVSDYYELGHHKVPRIWIVIADHHLARIFRKVKGATELIAEAEPGERDRVDALFVKDVADWLDAAAAEDVMDRVILISPPDMLGELRADLSDRVQSRVVAEVDKDLTKIGDQALQDELAKIVWF